MTTKQGMVRSLVDLLNLPRDVSEYVKRPVSAEELTQILDEALTDTAMLDRLIVDLAYVYILLPAICDQLMDTKKEVIN